jgi:hypothetical protein
MKGMVNIESQPRQIEIIVTYSMTSLNVDKAPHVSQFKAGVLSDGLFQLTNAYHDTGLLFLGCTVIQKRHQSLVIAEGTTNS